MSEQDKTKQRLEIAHVLFIDIVDYSKRLTDEQSEALQELNQIVRNTEAARDAETAGQLTILPTGDGMALVFTGSVEEPAECALEISHALRAQPSLPVRMGIHSGPVHHVKDANDRENIAGVGINIAQRVMDCGDAGHILVSKRVADDLAQQRRWQPYLHELGDMEVKHGVVVSLVNLYAETIGNPTPPGRFGKLRGFALSPTSPRKGLSPLTRAFFIVAVLLIALAIVSVIFAPAIMRSLGKSAPISPPQPPAPPSAPSFADTIKRDVAKKINDELQNAFAEKKKAEDTAKANGGRPGGPSLSVPEKSIAVLPFENLSSDKENAYFSEGIQDEILTRLSKIAALKVISRTSTQKYKTAPDNLREVGKQLGVAHILEGSVQKISNAVKVNVQLIRVATDEHVWAESYNRKLEDVFGVEGEVAGAIADQLKTKLSGAEQIAVTEKPTQNAAAYDAYLRAIALDNSLVLDTMKRVADLYAEAVRLDPQFALAWARLAVARSQLYFNGVELNINTAAAVNDAAERAMSLQPELGEAWVAQGAHRYRVLRDFKGALQSYEEALRRLPNSAIVLEQMAHLERRLGQAGVAQSHYRAAAQLDPRNIGTLLILADTFQSGRRYDEARTVVDRALEISPGNESALAVKALTFQAEGRLKEAAEILAKAPANSQDESLTFARAMQLYDERRFDAAIVQIQQNTPAAWANDPRSMTLLGLCQKFAGHDDEARATFTRAAAAMKPLSDSVVPVDARQLPCFLAWAYAGLGEKEKALEQAHHAIADYDDDALVKPFAETSLAIVQAQTGDIDSAIAALPHLLEVPNGLTVGDLRVNAQWDPLRKDPRFQKLIEEKPR